MADRAEWAALREQRMSETGAAEAYDAARLAFELGRAVLERLAVALDVGLSVKFESRDVAA